MASKTLVRLAGLTASATLGLGLGFAPRFASASEECASFEGLPTTMNSMLCQLLDPVSAIDCYRAEGEKLAPWRCRTKDAQKKHMEFVKSVQAAAGLYALDPQIENEKASRIMFAAARVMLIGIEAGDANSSICTVARSTIDYGCSRAFCSLDDANSVSIGGLGFNFGPVRDRYNDVCKSQYTRQCESASEIPSDCTGINAQRKKMSEHRDLMIDATSDNDVLTLLYQDYAAQKRDWRGALVDLAINVEDAAHNGTIDQSGAFEEYAKDYELSGIETVLRSQLRFYDENRAKLLSNVEYDNASKQIESALRQLPSCTTDCSELAAELQRFQRHKQPNLDTNATIALELAEGDAFILPDEVYELDKSIAEIRKQRELQGSD